jgi:hypothetical protein
LIPVKILLQRTLQTILDLEFGDLPFAGTGAAPPARHFFPFPTHFGSISLVLPAIGRRRLATNLFARYPQRESLLLLELKRLYRRQLEAEHPACAIGSRWPR